MHVRMMNEEDEKKLGSLEKIKRRILNVIKGPRDINSRSWVEVVIRMKESPKEWSALPSLAWINHLIFMLEEKLKRQWDALPSTALLNIFLNCELEHRLQSIPLVCKSWKYVTDDPRCWSSMIPSSVSPEDAFIKKRGYWYLNQYLPLNYNTRRLEEGKDIVHAGLKRLRTLIKKSGGGAAITTLYFSPFAPFELIWGHIDETYSEILHLIANCCPNLKHISFYVHYDTYMEAALLLLNKCKKLELIELFYDYGLSGRFDDEKPAYLRLLKSLSCLPDLHGLTFHFTQMHEHNIFHITVSTTIATHFPQLKLLRLHCRPLDDKLLSIILLSCLELQYLYVKVDRELYYNRDIIGQASVKIPEFYYERNYRIDTPSDHDNYSDNGFEDHVSKKIDHASRIVDDDFLINDDFLIDYYPDILKLRKEDGYVSILKEKMNNKKKNYQSCDSSLIKKKKKKNSTLKKNKKDQCVYADYVIQSK